MSYPYQLYGNDVPMIRHTDWASVAKQWASLRATVNVGPSHVQMRGDVDLRHIPPPPPPSPPHERVIEPSISTNQSHVFSSYIDHETHFPSFDQSIPFNSSIDQSNCFQNSFSDSNNFQNYDETGDFGQCYDKSSNISQNVLSNPSNESYYRYGNYDEENNDFYPVINQQINKNSLIDKLAAPLHHKCETFDYNHGNEEYNYYNEAENSMTTLPYNTQNLWNHPPPDHPDVHHLNYKESYSQPEPIVPKLFPIINDFHSNTNNTNTNINQSHISISNKKIIDNKIYDDLSHNTPFINTRPTKGLPAWIIDDMKKMKEKEHKRSNNSIDIYKDSHVHSRRDYEGDVVMEDVVKEADSDSIPGKSVTKLPIGISTTETDIDVVSLHDDDDDDIVPKVDYSSKSLMDLLAMLDENEISSIKIAVIRNSLTEVMKEITDDMIFNTVKSMFSRELSKGKKSHKHKGKSGTHDSSSIKQQSEVISQLLGLDVYESEDDDQDIVAEIKSDSVSQNFKTDKSNTHKHYHSKTESDKSSSKMKSSCDDDSKEKTQVSLQSSLSSKSKHRSRSRDNGKSRDKHRSHKKSKKHSGSEDKWSHDNYEKSRKKH